MRNSLNMISPIDGRYHQTTKDISLITSEQALMHYRVKVELAWLESLSKHPEIDCPIISNTARKAITMMQQSFDNMAAESIKKIELETRHDVKAVEYFIKNKLIECGEHDLATWVHFACTSEDINNSAYALMLKDLKQKVLLPELAKLCQCINNLSNQTLSSPMLAWTHGQTASPTTFGKELAVFSHRLADKLEKIADYKFSAKINGAVGNFNAHAQAYPNIDWQVIARSTINQLGLEHNEMSTQISNHDNLIGFICIYRQAMLILQDLSQDLWLYTHKNYIKLRKDTATQVGSSTMPHKINPIHFENAEGNIGLHKALAGQMIDKLPISRMQRDLSDSTTLRNIGTCFAHAHIAVSSLIKGIASIDANIEFMEQELNSHWEILTEAVQTILRKHGKHSAYEDLKSASQGQNQSEHDFKSMIDSLEISQEIRSELEQLRPEKYIGLASELAESNNLRLSSLLNKLISDK